jgi:hypothetical protein
MVAAIAVTSAGLGMLAGVAMASTSSLHRRRRLGARRAAGRGRRSAACACAGPTAAAAAPPSAGRAGAAAAVGRASGRPCTWPHGTPGRRYGRWPDDESPLSPPSRAGPRIEFFAPVFFLSFSFC